MNCRRNVSADKMSCRRNVPVDKITCRRSGVDKMILDEMNATRSGLIFVSFMERVV